MPALTVIDAPKPKRRTLAGALFAPLLLCVALSSNSTESAIANGETRTLTFSDSHTDESGSFTYMVNGVYDPGVLDKLNWFMRDWRHNEKTTMDPKLFDLVWEIYRESGSSQPIDVLSGYRSPETNAMLRRRSRQVAEHSQHMLGKAIDAHFLDVPTAKIRDIAMRLQAGGVGFYPTGNTPWVHIDSGSVRYWPRMSHDQIARLFPDGKTVFIPSDGVPLAGYQQAAAEIEARGGAIYAPTAQPGGGKSLLALLFGGGADDEEEGGREREVVASTTATGRGGASAQSFLIAQNIVGGGGPDAVSQAKRDLPRGETFMRAPDTAPPGAVAGAPEKLQALATLEPGDSGAAPIPPMRPREFALASADAGGAPVPPARPVEFLTPVGSLTALPPGSPGAESIARKGLIAGLLARNLPSAITRGVGALPSNALALADVQGGSLEPAGALARAAALSARLPPLDDARLTPLARAALLFAPLPPRRPASGGVLFAARIDRSSFNELSRAPTNDSPHALARPHIIAVSTIARSVALVATLTPIAEASTTFAAQPYGDLRSDAFTGPAVEPRDVARQADASLRGSTD